MTRSSRHNPRTGLRIDGWARSRQKGLTWVELMTVIAIVAVLAIIAAPSFSTLIATQRARTVASDLNLSLFVTRSAAIKRNGNASLCPKTASAAGWKDGWQVQTADCPAVAASAALENHGAVAGATISGPANGVEYQSSGRVGGGAAPSLTVTGISAAANVVKHVCVDLSGRPLTSDDSC